MEYTAQYRSPLGEITMASDGSAITGLWFDGQKYDRATVSPTCTPCDLPVFRLTARWLDEYFLGRNPGELPPLRTEATPFRRMVWDILRAIPYGQTVTYRDIASKIAERRSMGRMSAQAVGGAVGHNPISILIPCHRVIGADGALTGYAGGIDRKIRLLQLENPGFAPILSCKEKKRQ